MGVGEVDGACARDRSERSWRGSGVRDEEGIGAGGIEASRGLLDGASDGSVLTTTVLSEHDMVVAMESM